MVTPDLRQFAEAPYLVTFWYYSYGDGATALSINEYDGFTTGAAIWTLPAGGTETG